MGRGRTAALGAALAAACAALGFAHAAGEPPVREARWLAADGRLAALSTAPAECIKAPADPDVAWSVEVGRAAFRSPTILGGQAARAGLSCDSCHRNGRGNPDFSFPGVSGAPGSADVTSSLFSSHRGDGAANPKPIPDLAGPRETLKVEPQKLAPFIRGLVVEEFDGPEPPPPVLNALVDYVQALSPSACPRPALRPLRLADAVEDVRAAVLAALGALDRRDPATALVALEAARALLGRIDERYAAPGLAEERGRIAAASRELAAVQGDIRSGRPGRRALQSWIARSGAWEAQLARAERRSFYDRLVLDRALRAQAGPVATGRSSRAPHSAHEPS